ncbi:MAG: carbamate kinase [Deltaproteobacteria bacterium]|nr:carbamate kinase [Deltaproteobacteria bacterium]
MKRKAPKRPLIISLGGNALIQRNERGTIEEQFRNAQKAAKAAIELITPSTPVIITHGNGPIVGNLLIRSEAAKQEVPEDPLYMCDADSEGAVGFILQQALHNALGKAGYKRQAAAIVTQVVVDKNDRAFKNPTKPVGPYYSKKEAALLTKTRKYVMKEDSGRGYRRVVASPRPIRVIEADIIKRLSLTGTIVIAAGGGGVPVVEGKDKTLRGIDAVIDKDLATVCLAKELGSQTLIILTAIENAYVNFTTPSRKALGKITASEAKRYLKAGEFAPGSMGPKIEAAIEFIENGGKKVIITTPEKAALALKGRAGTIITP